MQLARWYRRPIEVMRDAHEEYGEVFTLRLPSQPPFVFFSEPAAIKQIFTSDPDEMHAGEANAILRVVVGDNSLLLLDGQRHLRERRLMMPSFHGERMRAYGVTMREIAARTIARWPRGRSFPIHEEMQAITLDEGDDGPTERHVRAVGGDAGGDGVIAVGDLNIASLSGAAVVFSSPEVHAWRRERRASAT